MCTRLNHDKIIVALQTCAVGVDEFIEAVFSIVVEELHLKRNEL